MLNETPEQAKEFFSQGNMKSQSKDYEGAIRNYDQAIELHPQFSYAFYYRAHAKMKIKNYIGAIEDFDKGIELDPEYFGAYYYRGNAKCKSGKYAEAIEDFDQAIKCYPQHLDALNKRAYAKCALYKEDEAIEDFTHILKLAPRYAEEFYRKDTKLASTNESKVVETYKQVQKMLVSEIAPDQLKQDTNKPLGEGAYATVYRGTWKNRTVAIKEYKKVQNRDITEKFQRELETMKQLNSAYIVSLYGFCSPSFCLVMEFIDNSTLANYLNSHRANPLTWVQRRKIALHIAYAVVYLHQLNIIHRDLKTENILLDKKLNAKVADFGLSQIKEPTSIRKFFIGSAMYMAPEIFNPYFPWSQECDMYSYGIVLWEITTHKIPYESFSPSKAADIYEHVVKEGKREIVPDNCPPKWTKLIHCLWHKNPKKRPTAEEAVKLLQDNDLLGEYIEKSNSCVLM